MPFALPPSSSQMNTSSHLNQHGRVRSAIRAVPGSHGYSSPAYPFLLPVSIDKSTGVATSIAVIAASSDVRACIFHI